MKEDILMMLHNCKCSIQSSFFPLSFLISLSCSDAVKAHEVFHKCVRVICAFYGEQKELENAPLFFSICRKHFATEDLTRALTPLTLVLVPCGL